MQPRISVIIITYNQESVIHRSIESVIKQKDYVYELIISDDCSRDRTWEVINIYKESYPNLIVTHQNHINLGIFKHIEKTWTYPTGDIVYYLAGDDEFCNDLFKQTIDFINKNKINFKKLPFTIYSDYIAVYPSGKKKLQRNNLINKYDAIELKIRKLISNRTTGISMNVLKQFKPVEEIGIFTDGLIDIQTQIYSKINYYLPIPGSIYYKGIGISSKHDQKKAFYSFIKLNCYYLSNINKLKQNDILWLNFMILRTRHLLSPSVWLYLRLLLLYIRIPFLKYSFTFFIKQTLIFLYCFIVLLIPINKRNV